LESGRVHARLEDPGGDNSRRSALSPDGTRFIVASDHLPSVHIWDLCAIGRELKLLGIPWELPLPASEMPPENPSRPLKVTVLLGDPKQGSHNPLSDLDRAIAQKPQDAEVYWRRGKIHVSLGHWQSAIQDFTIAINKRPLLPYLVSRGNAYERTEKYKEAAADWQAALETRPLSKADEASVCNSLAWFHVICPANLREPVKALALASRAVRLEPTNWAYVNTLGACHYRLGQYDQAVETLRRCLRNSRAPASELFFLALSYQQLNENTQARECFDQAMYWWRIHEKSIDAGQRWELELMQKEAAGLGLHD
jgi:lipopolysaccharide biosynthesis regulator YciM